MTNTEQILDKYAVMMINQMKKDVSLNHKSSGRLLNSMAYDVLPNKVIIEMNAYGEAIAGNVDTGAPRKRAFIPIKPLVEWVIRKNLTLKGTTAKGKPITAKMARSKKHPSRLSARQQALGIAIAISKAAKKRSGKGLYTGGKTDPFIERALNFTFRTRKFTDEIKDALVKDLEFNFIK